MNNPDSIKEYILDTLQTSRLAVLATEGNGQPHASLIAITPFGDFRQIIFATYRDTLKYRNISNNNKVAVLIESEVINDKGLKQSLVLTIIGHTKEVNTEQYEAAYRAHLEHHPEMESFMLSADRALFIVIAQSYQVVYGIDDISWISAEDFNAF